MIISITYSIREKIVWVVLTGIVICPLTPCLTYFLATFCSFCNLIISITYIIRGKVVWIVLTSIITDLLTTCLTFFSNFLFMFFFSFNFISCKASLFKNNIKINYEIICMYFSFIYLIFLLDETQETLTRTHGVG